MGPGNMLRLKSCDFLFTPLFFLYQRIHNIKHLYPIWEKIWAFILAAQAFLRLYSKGKV